MKKTITGGLILAALTVGAIVGLPDAEAAEGAPQQKIITSCRPYRPYHHPFLRRRRAWVHQVREDL